MESSRSPAPLRHLILSFAILLFATGVRLAYLADSSDYPAFSVPIVDALEYDHGARELAGGHSPSPQFFWQPFFYPFYLSVVYSATGGSILAAKILQALIGGATCVLVYHLGKRLFGRTSGLIAAGIAALYGPLVFYETELLATGWAAFWSVLLIILFLRTAESQRPWMYALLGLCGGLSVLTRPTFLPFLLGGCLWLAWRWFRGQPRRVEALNVAALVIGFALVTAPVATEAYRVTGRFTFLPSSGGINAYIGNHPDMCAMATVGVGFEWDELTGLPAREGITGMWAQQRYFYRRTLSFLVDDPLGFVGRLLKKALRFINSREIPRNVDVYLVRQWSLLQRVLTWKAFGFGFPFGLLLPLAMTGLVLQWRRVPTPLVLFVVLYPLAIIAVFVTARYRIPVIPVLAVLAGAGCTGIAGLLRARNRVGLACAGAGLIALVLAGWLPGPFCEEQQRYDASLFANIGYYYLRHGDKETAFAFYDRSVGLDPRYAEAQSNLGNLLAEQGKLAQAEQHYRDALDSKPQLAAIQSNYAALLLNLGRIDEAIEHLRAAVRLNPRLAQTHTNLGIALMRHGEGDEAIAEHREAVQLEPRDATAHYNLGAALAQAGDHAGAVGAYEKALNLRPGDVRILYGLAYSLERLGRRADAIDRYEAVLRIHSNYRDAGQRLERLKGSPR